MPASRRKLKAVAPGRRKSLPLDIIRKMAAYLPTATLSNLSLTCRAYRTLAQQVLFKQVVLTSEYALMAYVRIIGEKPSLARAIRCLTIDRSGDPNFAHRVFASHLPRISSTLQTFRPYNSDLEIKLRVDYLSRFIAHCISQLQPIALDLTQTCMSWNTFCTLWNNLPHLKMISIPILSYETMEESTHHSDALPTRLLHTLRISPCGYLLSSARLSSILNAVKDTLECLEIHITKDTRITIPEMLSVLQSLPLASLTLSLAFHLDQRSISWLDMVKDLLPLLPSLKTLTLIGPFKIWPSNLLLASNLRRIHLIDSPIVTSPQAAVELLNSGPSLHTFDITVSQRKLDYLNTTGSGNLLSNCFAVRLVYFLKWQPVKVSP